METLQQTAARLRREWDGAFPCGERPSIARGVAEEWDTWVQVNRLAHDPVLHAMRLLDLAHSKDVNEPGYEEWLGRVLLRPVQDLTGANFILPEVCNAAGKLSVTITALEAFITGYEAGAHVVDQ